MKRSLLVVLLFVAMAMLLVSACGAAAVQGAAADLHRSRPRTKLAGAFPDIDRIVREFADPEHIPGAAWGIVIDGELAHVGVTGYRDVDTKSPVTPDRCFASRR